ncbi:MULTISPECIES: spinster family MFS transporter [Blastomonas]|jgi:MFS family permease|uniref:MFS transporter n=1 Tax=Blastomonas fulva TaxID=1550728 RepID=A0ABN5B533_9SPHN|nr:MULTISPECIES: MFS transporter [Blastomonas]ASR51931.1 MFS transporter [Blastomonas fulva]MCO5794283.1 MFS transporter [Blastomonas sp.]MDM7928954.1 MFS transporter [Blastomonas fulva]MDM7965855.1 MFS transporter [Blastomonas fulva]
MTVTRTGAGDTLPPAGLAVTAAPAATAPTYTAMPRTMLWTLMIIYIFNFLDRQIVSILAEPIKRDFGLSDTQLGLMTGLAFALFYTLLGIPIARYADRSTTNRVSLIAWSVAIWSAMTMACGAARTFPQLLLARVGVGVGEAGCTPAAHSLISDSVPPEKRSSAIAFYGLGIPIGSLLGMVIGGGLADAYGWRTAFMAVGLPGLVLAVLVPFLMKEPRRVGMVAGDRVPKAKVQVPVGEALRELATSRCFVLLCLAGGLIAFLSYGKTVWVSVLFIRNFGLTPGETGLYLGVSLGVASMIGTWGGGKLADHFGKRDRKHMLTGPAIAIAVAAPMLFLAYSASDWRVALALLILPTAMNIMYYGPVYACVQGLVRPELRAVAASVMLFSQNLIGLGLGPLLFGVMSDAFQPLAGADSVRWVLYGAAWLGLIPAFLFWRASLRLTRELKSG